MFHEKRPENYLFKHLGDIFDMLGSLEVLVTVDIGINLEPDQCKTESIECFFVKCHCTPVDRFDHIRDHADVIEAGNHVIIDTDRFLPATKDPHIIHLSLNHLD